MTFPIVDQIDLHTLGFACTAIFSGLQIIVVHESLIHLTASLSARSLPRNRCFGSKRDSAQPLATKDEQADRHLRSCYGYPGFTPILSCHLGIFLHRRLAELITWAGGIIDARHPLFRYMTVAASHKFLIICTD